MRVESRAYARPKPNAVRRVRCAPCVAVSIFLTLVCPLAPAPARAAQSELTPLQQEIKVQTARLSSSDAEERRDAVMRLGAMRRPEASRAAAAALNDPAEIVRATAARAILALPAQEVADRLALLLGDKKEFVRREVAYALGETRDYAAYASLKLAVFYDKEASVRGAAAVAIGRIGDARAVPVLSMVLNRRLPGTGLVSRVTRAKSEENEFVRRAAAEALGRIGSREGVPALIDALNDRRAGGDVRREAARALGLIGDPAAAPALRSVLTDRDPYLSRVAFEALRRLDPATATRPAGGGS
ncbi:MAG TPA: HEAT repeat domain-containing protein [Pyrinomonadaceae bacterium]|jgi:HEAT repeat protein